MAVRTGENVRVKFIFSTCSYFEEAQQKQSQLTRNLANPSTE